jgi:hypothetical protein
MNARQPFPAVIDSSMLSAFRSCPRKAELEYLWHWKPKSDSVHLHAGKSFARGLEVARLAFFVEGLSPERAVARGIGALLEAYGDFDCPEDSAKSATRMAGAMEYYFASYPMESDSAPPATLGSGKRAIEFSFVEPIDVVHPESGEPILYSGRFDEIVQYAGGLFGEDDKTTSSLGPKWSQQWDLRSQFTAYTWGAKQSGIVLQGFLVRGISILKTKYETQQAVTYRPAWMVERWYEEMLESVRRMIQMWGKGYFNYNLDHACAEFGGCMFRQPCLSADPEPWLKVAFERRRWDPVTREETKLEVAE